MCASPKTHTTSSLLKRSTSTPSGSFVRRIGAKGRGPGEYLNPRGIGVSDGRLYVFDYNTQNILTYGEDGSFIGSSSKSALMNSGIYITSFFFSGDDMILYASSNSPVQDMLRWDAATDGLTAVSERSREMMPEEVMMGENYIFGDRDNPFIYNNFNDTVYVLEGGRPVPAMLMRLGKYRFEYGDLTFDGLMSLSAGRLNFLWIAAAGDNILIAYSVVNLGDESSSPPSPPRRGSSRVCRTMSCCQYGPYRIPARNMR